MNRNLQPLIDPSSIAIFGASANPKRLGGVPIALLQERGYAGPIFPINPKYQEIAGLQCYPDIAALPQAVDLLVVAVPAADVMPALKQAVEKGIRSAVIFAAGYAEAGDEEGRQLQEALTRYARDTGILVAGPNCMGFGNLDIHAYSTFTAVFRSVEPPEAPRDVALVTQSGSICSAVYAAGRSSGVRFNVVVNTGNEACIEFSEYLDYLSSRSGTNAIVGYLEGLRDGASFQRVAGRMRDNGQLLALLKVGDSCKGARAAASHTAAVTGSQEVYRAMFDRLCVVPARDIQHLGDIAYLSRFRHIHSGKRVAILTISGAIGALLSDQFTQAGVDVPTFGPDIQDALHRGIPRYGMVLNPVDLTGNIVNQHEFVAQALNAILGSEDVDFAVVFAPGYLIDRMADSIMPIAGSAGKLIAVIRNGLCARQAELEENGVPVFDDTTRAVNALSSLARWQDNRRRYSNRLEQHAKPAIPAAASAAVQTAREQGRRHLNECEAKRLLHAFGIPTVAEQAATSAAQAVAAAENLGYPVAVKILSPDILHKSDLGGVTLNLATPAAVSGAYADMMSSVARQAPTAHIDGVVVQRQLGSGPEIFLSVMRDPTFGLVLSVGIGGLWIELHRDIAHAPLPVDKDEAMHMLRSLKAWPVLCGMRNTLKIDVQALASTMERLSNAALAMGDDIDLLEINPLLPCGDGIAAVDAVIALCHAESGGHGAGLKQEDKIFITGNKDHESCAV